MSLQRSMTRSAALAAVLLVAGAAGAAAQERPLFEWRGRVDREMRLVMRGRSLDVQFASWKDRLRDHTRVYSVLPREDGYVTARVRDGRGDVDVVQQPSYRNDYTAVLRIRDARGGADNYRIEAYWRPTRGGGWGNDRGGWGNDRGDRDRDRDRDGDDDRGRNNGGWNNGRWNDGGAWNNGRGEFHFSGSVDDELQIRIRGGDVEYRNMRGERIRDAQSNLRGALPNRDVNVRVDRHNGRGNIEVIQQPSSRNGYTAIIRVRDRNAGADYYDFDVNW